MTDETDIIGALIGEGERATLFHGGAKVWSEMAVRAAALRGYEAGKAEAAAELAMARKALTRCEKWRERYLSNPLDGYQPIDDGSKAVPPGGE